MFPDRNLDAFQLPSSRDLVLPLLRAGSASAQVCSGLLTHLTRHCQLLTEASEKATFPSLGSQICSHYLDNYYPDLLAFMYRTLFCVLLQGVLRCPLAFCLGYVLYK